MEAERSMCSMDINNGGGLASGTLVSDADVSAIAQEEREKLS